MSLCLILCRCDCKSEYKVDEERSSKYPFVGALCMNGGDVDNSYTTKSLLQVLSSSLHIVYVSIRHAYTY